MAAAVVMPSVASTVPQPQPQPQPQPPARSLSPSLPVGSVSISASQSMRPAVLGVEEQSSRGHSLSGSGGRRDVSSVACGSTDRVDVAVDASTSSVPRMDVDASSRAAVPRVDGVPSALALAAAAEIKRLREALAQRDDTVAALRRQVDAADRRAADAVAASTAAVAAREDAARRAVECQAELQRVVQLYDRLRQASEDALRQRDARVAELELASRSSLAVATEMHDVTRRSLAVSALSQRQAARVHRDTRRMLAESMHAGDRSGDSGGGGGGGVGGSPVVGSPLSQLTRLR
jgi:hypothetical protein